jgi:hypothetical protein
LNKHNLKTGDLVRIWSVKENEAGEMIRVTDNTLGVIVDKAWSQHYYKVLVRDKVIVVMSSDVEVLECDLSKLEIAS